MPSEEIAMSPDTETPAPHILVIEDESDIARFVELELSCEGYRVEVAGDGMAGLQKAREHPPDLVILDLMLPRLDGMEVCRRLRQHSDVPILMLTARDSVKHKVAGLDAGANDYLTKPFSLEELLARVRVQLRQRFQVPKTLLQVGDLGLDTATREVRRGDQEVHLTPREFDLLAYLMRHPRQVLTREQILEAVWGYDFEGEDNVLEVYISYLRTKLEGPDYPKMIHTVRGVGYVIRP